MSIDNLVFAFDGLKKTIAELDKPDALFKNATWDQIDTNPELRRFLQSYLAGRYPQASAANADLGSLVVLEAERIRGRTPWTALDIPAEYPRSVDEHQTFNLIERLYLSKDYRSGKKALFSEKLPTKKELDQRKTNSVIGVSIVSIGLASIVWAMRRRSLVAGKQPQTQP